MKIRESLFALLQEIIRRDNLPGWQIARACNTSHTRAWHLLHGRIEHFNTETIIDMLWRFGVDIDVTVVKEVP